MKKIVLIMLVLLTIGVACAFNNQMMVVNHSTKQITVGVAIGGSSYGQRTILPPKAATTLLGYTGMNHKVKAVLGSNLDLSIPGFYEIEHIILEHNGNNRVDFYFPGLTPVKPGYPGEEQ